MGEPFSVDLELLSSEYEPNEIPEQHYNVVLRMSSINFRKICVTLQGSDSITVMAERNEISFRSSDGRVISSPPKLEVVLMRFPISTTFATSSMVAFAKSAANM